MERHYLFVHDLPDITLPRKQLGQYSSFLSLIAKATAAYLFTCNVCEIVETLHIHLTAYCTHTHKSFRETALSENGRHQNNLSLIHMSLVDDITINTLVTECQLDDRILIYYLYYINIIHSIWMIKLGLL